MRVWVGYLAFWRAQVKAQVNCVDEDVRSPLYIAVRRGFVDVVALLLKMGANFEQTDANGVSVMSLAAFHVRRLGGAVPPPPHTQFMWFPSSAELPSVCAALAQPQKRWMAEVCAGVRPRLFVCSCGGE